MVEESRINKTINHGIFEGGNRISKFTFEGIL